MKKKILSFVTTLVVIFSIVGIMPKPEVDAATTSNWYWPSDHRTVTADWPRYSRGGYHSGIDFGVPLNSNVYSTCDGEVVDVLSWANSYGKHIKIRATVNGQTVYIRYCHLNDFRVNKGDKVKAGQVIGISGSTGNSTGPHLHYEVRNANDYQGTSPTNPNLNPRNYLPGSSLSYHINDSAVTSSPVGFCKTYDGGTGCVYVNGAGYDPDDINAQIDVHVYLKDSAGNNHYIGDLKANAQSTEANSRYNCGEWHGFAGHVSTNMVGTYKLCIGLLDVKGGNNAGWLECGDVTIKNASQEFGSDFNAIIGHEGKVLTASHDGKIKNYSKNANPYMIAQKYTWHFIKNSDGSYGIWSYYGGRILETESEYSGATIRLASSYTNSVNQRWFIEKNGNNYLLRPACSVSRALDVPGNAQDEGTALQLYTKNYTAAQLFSINNLNADKEVPTIKKITASNITNDSFKIVVNASDNNGVKNVKVSTSNWNGKIKKVYNAVQINASTWECTVKSSDLSNEHGAFYTTACAYDYNGNVAGSESLETKIGFYTVTFDANTGSVGTKSKSVVYGYTYDRQGALPIPSKTGYTFQGWYTAKTGGTKITNTTKVTATSNHILYAQWKSNNCSVTFNANEGSCSTPNKNVSYNATYGALPTPTRTGYTFLGWYTAKTGGTKITADTKVTITGSQTLYAQWKANTYTRTLDLDGGKCDRASVTVTFGQKIGTLPTPTKAGYTFAGWYTEKTGGSKITSDWVIKGANNCSVYARWNANTYKRFLNPEGGKCEKLSIDVTFGKKIGELPVPTKTGYKFIGWYNVHGDMVNPENIISGEGSAADGVYYARWKAKGDFNKDSTINVRDIAMFQKYLTLQEEFAGDDLSEADLNDDGKVNVFDAVIMKRIFKSDQALKSEVLYSPVFR